MLHVASAFQSLRLIFYHVQTFAGVLSAQGIAPQLCRTVRVAEMSIAELSDGASVQISCDKSSPFWNIPGHAIAAHLSFDEETRSKDFIDLGCYFFFSVFLSCLVLSKIAPCVPLHIQRFKMSKDCNVLHVSAADLRGLLRC